MGKELHEYSEEWLNPKQKELLALMAAGAIAETPDTRTSEEVKIEMQEKNAARRERNMKSGQSRIDAENTHLGPGSVLRY